MKYKLLQKLPGMEVGTIIEGDKLGNIILSFGYTNISNIEEYPDFFEKVKEAKTIYDLKKGDKYYVLDDGNEITKYEVPSNAYFINPYCRFDCFVTEREAKRNKLLREFATRTDKWLPSKQYELFTTWDGEQSSWDGDEFDIMHYHMGLIFRNKEEYNKYITSESKDLLFKI